MEHKRYNFGISNHIYFCTEKLLILTIRHIKSFPGTSAFPSDDNLMSSYALEAQKFIVPQTWAFSKDNPPALIAYEFLSSISELPAPPEQFAIELYEGLKRYGLESVLGLRRLLHMRNNNSWETTPDGIKANVTHYGTVPPKDIVREMMIKVVFTFDEQGELQCIGNCRRCCNHCRHCNHCDCNCIIL